MDNEIKIKDETREDGVFSDGDAEPSEGEGRIYEAGYIIVPTVAEEELAAEIAKVKDAVEKNSEAIISEAMPELRQLSYEMAKHILGKNKKYDKGYFGWIKFESSADRIGKIKKEMREIDSVLRFLLVKTVRENTMAGVRSRIPRSAEAAAGRTTAPRAQEGHSKMTVEEMDKEISETLGSLEANT